MRKRLFEIVEVSQKKDRMSQVYDFTMMFVIIVSLIPLLFKQSNSWLIWMDRISVIIFSMDYCFRLITADYKLNKHKMSSFIKYSFTPMAIMHLVAI